MSVVVVGAATTRFGMFVQRSLRDLAAEAADLALADAALDPGDIGLVAFGNAAAGLLTGQEMIRAQTSLSASRVAGRPTFAVENACASGSSALHLAALAVGSGAHDAVLAVGAEKMTGPDRALPGRALATGTDVEAGTAAASGGSGGPVFMEIYAAEARAYLERSNASVHDVAEVAAKSTRNGSLNPIAQVREEIDAEAVLAARMIVDPLTRPMCSSIGDGAAAVVVCSPDFARRRGLHGPALLASVLQSGHSGGDPQLVGRTARLAFDQAGIAPDELDVVELHDAAAPAELLLTEELGLAGPGDGAKPLRDGTSALGGRCPVNPSGGLLARGHAIGATGVAQVVELVDQLRGRAGARQRDGARLALAENAGGFLGGGPAACVVTILQAAGS